MTLKKTFNFVLLIECALLAQNLHGHTSLDAGTDDKRPKTTRPQKRSIAAVAATIATYIGIGGVLFGVPAFTYLRKWHGNGQRKDGQKNQEQQQSNILNQLNTELVPKLANSNQKPTKPSSTPPTQAQATTSSPSEETKQELPENRSDQPSLQSEDPMQWPKNVGSENFSASNFEDNGPPDPEYLKRLGELANSQGSTNSSTSRGTSKKGDTTALSSSIVIHSGEAQKEPVATDTISPEQLEIERKNLRTFINTMSINKPALCNPEKSAKEAMQKYDLDSFTEAYLATSPHKRLKFMDDFFEIINDFEILNGDKTTIQNKKKNILLLNCFWWQLAKTPVLAIHRITQKYRNTGLDLSIPQSPK